MSIRCFGLEATTSGQGSNHCHVNEFVERDGDCWADSVANLQAICKHHHRAEHQGGWTVTMTPAGLCTWTDPFGQQFVTHPVDHRELAA